MEETKWTNAMAEFNMHFVGFIHPIYHCYKTSRNEVLVIRSAHQWWTNLLVKMIIETNGKYDRSRVAYNRSTNQKVEAVTRAFGFDENQTLPSVGTLETIAAKDLRWKNYCDAILDLLILEYHAFVNSQNGEAMKMAFIDEGEGGAVDTIKICKLLLDSLIANANNTEPHTFGKRISPRSFKIFLFWIHRLILLAARCKGVTDEQIAQLFKQHAHAVEIITITTTTPKISFESKTAADDSSCSNGNNYDNDNFYDVCKWISTKKMVEMFDAYVEKPIPSPLIRIINGYCEIDPLSMDDEFILRKLSNKIN